MSHLQIVVLLLGLDPNLALTLRVNQQWVTLGLGDYGRILQGQFIIGQALQGPFRGLNGVHQHVDHVDGAGIRDVPVLQQAFPSLQQTLPEFLIKRP